MADAMRLVPSWRLNTAFFELLGTLVLYMNRVDISFALVCMTKPPGGYNVTDGSTYTTNSTLGGIYSGNSSQTHSFVGQPEFDWDRKLVGFILSSFFVGNILTQLPAGWAATRFSPKWLIVTGMGITIVCSFLCPTAARAGWGYLVALQIIKGLGCGAFYPCLQLLISSWSPPHERSRLYAIAYSGAPIGNIVGFLSGGFLCSGGFDGGWPSVFYVYSMCGTFWLILFSIFVYDTPTVHPFISEGEKEYIQRCKGETLKTQDTKTVSVPWKSIATSLPLLAIVTAEVAYCWLWYTALTSIPIYINDVLKFNIKKNGLASSLPFVLNLCVGILASYVADKIIQRNIFRPTTVRKLAVSGAMLLPATLIISAGFLKSYQGNTAVLLISFAVGCLAFSRPGNHVNMVEIAPRFSSVIMGIDNTICNITGLLAPIITGQLASNGTQAEWRNVFFLAGGISLIGEIVYLIFGSAEIQPWANDPDDEIVDDVEVLKCQSDPLMPSGVIAKSDKQ